MAGVVICYLCLLTLNSIFPPITRDSYNRIVHVMPTANILWSLVLSVVLGYFLLLIIFKKLKKSTLLTKSKIFLVLPALLLLTCCKDNDHYHINCVENFSDYRGILFLTESANYQSLQRLNDTTQLKSYLSSDEFNMAFDTVVSITQFDTSTYFKTEFVPWDTLFIKDAFVAELVLLKDNTDNRGYYFQIRTYDSSHHLISTQDFATWADRKKKYCSGDYSKKDFTFTVACNEGKTKYKFDSVGHIISE